MRCNWLYGCILQPYSARSLSQPHSMRYSTYSSYSVHTEYSHTAYTLYILIHSPSGKSILIGCWLAPSQVQVLRRDAFANHRTPELRWCRTRSRSQVQHRKRSSTAVGLLAANASPPVVAGHHDARFDEVGSPGAAPRSAATLTAAAAAAPPGLERPPCVHRLPEPGLWRSEPDRVP